MKKKENEKKRKKEKGKRKKEKGKRKTGKKLYYALDGEIFF